MENLADTKSPVEIYAHLLLEKELEYSREFFEI